MPRIAFYTFGILLEKQGHPKVQGFFDRIDSYFSQAESSEGFIALDNHDWGPYVSPRFYDPEIHAGAPATLSLWSDLESVFAFAYRNGHGEGLKQRHEWFIKPEWPSYAAWWVQDDHIPTRAEACERLESLHDNGAGPFSFDFKTPFDHDGKPFKLNRELIELRIRSNGK